MAAPGRLSALEMQRGLCCSQSASWQSLPQYDTRPQRAQSDNFFSSRSQCLQALSSSPEGGFFFLEDIRIETARLLNYSIKVDAKEPQFSRHHSSQKREKSGGESLYSRNCPERGSYFRIFGKSKCPHGEPIWAYFLLPFGLWIHRGPSLPPWLKFCPQVDI